MDDKEEKKEILDTADEESGVGSCPRDDENHEESDPRDDEDKREADPLDKDKPEKSEPESETVEADEAIGESAQKDKDSDTARDLDTVDKRDLEIASLNERYLRLLAEFENFRKRNEAARIAEYTEGEKAVILKVLPLIDNFERALKAVPKDDKDEAFVLGIEKVYRAFTEELKSLGVSPIEAVGETFDCSLHNAVMHIEDEDAGENVVVEEFQKGYMFKDKVLRYAMVKVAN